MTKTAGRAFLIGIFLAALGVIGVLVWQGIAVHGAPDPTQPNTSPTVAFLDIGVLVFREGLECILVLAAVTASMTGERKAHRRPVALGAGLAFIATLITWFIATGMVGPIDRKRAGSRFAGRHRVARGDCPARHHELVFSQDLLGRLDSRA